MGGTWNRKETHGCSQRRLPLKRRTPINTLVPFRMEYDSLNSEDVVFSDQDEEVEYEDLETSPSDSQSSYDPRSVVEWSQRLLIASRVLTIVHIVLNIRLVMFAWSLYSVLGRFFIMLPLSIEIVLSLIFEALGTSQRT